ncbi:type II toxin-antitoxin system Phd/YefM family antitoxin [Mycobacteroides abscessus]|uniref:type II toxin-antitoxin system Phd/YefM family antitoxin n=1 Tax=Mycobacteroides abscessus TaxID=36809 RepID=UPI0009A7F763|nr:hypothetical protein [Mycobacteroides abscessus]SLJ75693.1 Uncharacterised protein [Mycobacteroides abscessus subsp. abscessus]SLJ77472.1 Uncharacterised protein [Mycobacteroides abscessus subsp. abscessus]
MAKPSPNRMRSVTEARSGLNALLADAEDGITTHIVKNSKIVAHLVPSNALILDGAVDLLDQMLTRLALDAAADSTPSFVDGRLAHAGDFMGELLAWTWTTDQHVFCYTLAQYHRALERRVRQDITREQLVPGLETALAVAMSDSEIRDVRSYLNRQSYWCDYYPNTNAPLSFRPLAST